MIRINGSDFIGTVQYPADRIVAFLMTSDLFGEVVAKIENANDISIVNEGQVVATYGCTFNGIERAEGGYRVIFNRYPMSAEEVSRLRDTVGDLEQRLARLESLLDAHPD